MYYLSCKKYLSTSIVFRHHPLNLIVIVKHEYLRSRAYIRLSLSSPLSLSSSHRYSIHAFLDSVIAIQILPLSRYSCFYLGSLHPRIFLKQPCFNLQVLESQIKFFAWLKTLQNCTCESIYRGRYRTFVEKLASLIFTYLFQNSRMLVKF